MSESNDRAAGGGYRSTFSRSVSWSEHSPSNRKPPTTAAKNKSRSLFPPLRPLSINKRSIEEWPSAGSDDLGVWPQTETPRGRGSIIGSEFQFKRDKLAFYDKECSRIAEHVYLGSDTVAKNHELLRKNGITHVLNCVGFVCPEYFKSEFVYKTLWLQDSPTEDITSILYDVFDYFEDVRLQGGRVLVHCCQGVSRSTSLVIAYLMWREGQSFEDAFHYVKNARGITNPNMGFACQLLQCQKRVVNVNANSNANTNANANSNANNVMPSSPNSVLRMYRMAPHSPYDPLHVVPKMVDKPCAKALDSRGAFIVHVPSAIYVWTGKNCSSVMSCNAQSAATQVVRYEKANAPIVSICEDEEPMEFWVALSNQELLFGSSDKVEVVEKERMEINGGVKIHPRKVDEYDLDFGIFHKALAGGVVPVSNTGSETLLPARENSWGRLRRKLANRIMKGLFTSSKCCDTISPKDELLRVNVEEDDKKYSVVDHSSNYLSSSSSYIEYIVDHSCDKAKDSLVFIDRFVPNIGSSLPPTHRKSDSFPCSLGNSPKFSSMSPTLSPSNSDCASSFTFSPASTNWSDLSFMSSRQPSPSSGLESAEQPVYLNKDASLLERSSSLRNAAVSSSSETLLVNHTMVRTNSYRGPNSNPSIAERRGSKPPPQMFVPSSVCESLRAHKVLVRSQTFTLPNRDENLMK